MKKFKILGIVVIAAVLMTFGSEIGELISMPGAERWVPTAEAVVGRPLTPVSVAGVARRTVRRCAVGVYHCSLPASASGNGLLGQSGLDSMPPGNTLPDAPLEGSGPAAG